MFMGSKMESDLGVMYIFMLPVMFFARLTLPSGCFLQASKRMAMLPIGTASPLSLDEAYTPQSAGLRKNYY
jgi:hypothetical protein